MDSRKICISHSANLVVDSRDLAVLRSHMADALTAAQWRRVEPTMTLFRHDIGGVSFGFGEHLAAQQASQDPLVVALRATVGNRRIPEPYQELACDLADAAESAQLHGESWTWESLLNREARQKKEAQG